MLIFAAILRYLFYLRSLSINASSNTNINKKFSLLQKHIYTHSFFFLSRNRYFQKKCALTVVKKRILSNMFVPHAKQDFVSTVFPYTFLMNILPFLWKSSLVTNSPASLVMQVHLSTVIPAILTFVMNAELIIRQMVCLNMIGSILFHTISV